jgi:hypothetical protein
VAMKIVAGQRGSFEWERAAAGTRTLR